MKDTLVLFDINGTLIRRDERTDIPYTNAVNGLLGTQNAMEGVDTSARSDKDVLMEVLCRHGRTFSEELWKTFRAMYTRQLEAFFGTDVCYFLKVFIWIGKTFRERKIGHDCFPVQFIILDFRYHLKGV